MDLAVVRIGQPAEIKLETFPFTKYGTIGGEVADVSSDAIQDDKLGLFYSTRIAMSRVVMNVDGRDVNMSPGMAATVEIKTDQRRLSPLAAAPYKQESLRER